MKRHVVFTIVMTGLIAISAVDIWIGHQVRQQLEADLNHLDRLGAINAILTPALQLTMLGVIILLWRRLSRDRVQSDRDARAQLHNLNASLKAQSLAVERLHERNAALENFSSMVAHDLKAPLRQATMLLHLAKRANSEDEQHQFCNQAIESLDRANTLVDSFLNLAQLDEHAPETSLEDVGEIFHAAVRELAILNRKAPRHIQISPLGKVYCDPDLIRQVAINLLTNALKYARPETPLEIRVYAIRADSMLTVCVEDNGVGIPPELAEQVLQPSVRGDTANGAQKGRGLGLAVCQTIIAAHGGSLRVLPGAQRGARIQFTLPLLNPDEPAG